MKKKPFRSIALALAIAVPALCHPAGARSLLDSIDLSAMTAPPDLASISSVPTPAASITDGVYALLLHDDRGKGLNIQYASKEIHRAQLCVDTANGEQNELFRIVNRGGGCVSIHPLHAPDLCLNARLGGIAGDTVTLYPYEDGDAASLWLPLKNSDDGTTFQNKYTGELVMDVKDGSYADGTPAICWYANGYQRAQSFFVTPWDGRQKVTAATIPNGFYTIASFQQDDRVINVTFASTDEDRAGMALDPWDGQSNEIFYFERVRGGCYTIAPAYCRTLHLNCPMGAGARPGDRLTLHRTEAGDKASWWEIIRQPDGTYSFRNAASGLMIDLANGDTFTGNPLLVYTANGFESAQNFHLYQVDDPRAPQQAPNLINGQNASADPPADSSEAKILARLEAMADGSYGSGIYRAGTRYSGPYASEQCKGFAKQVHISLFGYNIGSTRAKPHNYQISISTSRSSLVGSLTSLSAQSDGAVRELFSRARPGDVIQLRRSHGGSHSMIFMSSDTNGLRVFECNVDGRNGIRTANYNWAQFRRSNAAVSVYTARDYWLH